LNAGEWFRRGRLFMVSPVRGDHRRFQAEIPLIVLSKFPEPALLKAALSRPMKPFSTWWGTAATISFRVASAGLR
jgi:hypothetical protein